MKIKAITLWQPWASFMAKGFKKNETRSWRTNYRGKLAIHAASLTKSQIYAAPFDVYELARKHFGHYKAWDYGKILCVVELLNCKMSNGIIDDPSSLEYMLGNYAIGRYVWETKILHVFEEPIPAKGKQGLWDWEWLK